MTPSVWDQVLSRVETKVNKHSFYTWFKPTSFLRDEGTTVVIRVPNPHFSDWLTRHYGGILAEAFAEIGRSGTELSFLTVEVLELSAAEEQLATSLPPEEPEAAPLSSGLNPRYRFESFVVGASNQFAHAGCRAVAESPSRSYNPLFIYGGVGLGKTHLMHAIGQYVLKQTPNLRLTYISSERFMNEMINALRYERILEFRERYRSIDILLVDDIQFLAGKEGHADRVLPHVQRPVRLVEADRHQQRLPAPRDSPARGSPPFALRMGAHRRHPAAGSRDESGHSQEEGGGRGRPTARQRGHLHRRQDQVEHP